MSLNQGQLEIIAAIKSMDTKMNERLDNLEQQNKVIIERIEHLTEEYKQLSTEQKNIRKELSNQQIELEILKQKNISTDIIIFGIPDNQLNTVEAVTSALKQYKIEINVTDYHKMYRLKNNKNTSKHTPICVELNSRTIKTLILSRKRKYGPILHTVDTASTENIKKIIIKHRMTPYFSDLLNETFKFKEKNKYKFAWFQENVILLTKEESSKPICILSSGDLKALENSA